MGAAVKPLVSFRGAPKGAPRGNRKVLRIENCVVGTVRLDAVLAAESSVE